MDHLAAETFDQAVSSGTVVVKVTGDGCGPCRMLQPILEEMEKETPEVKFAEADVFSHPSIAARFGIGSIPQLILFKDGKEQRRITGFKPKSELAKWLEG